MTTHDKCPHCGAKWMFDIPPSTHQYACGSCGGSAFTQSNTCSERTAHAATRDRLKEMTEIAEELAEKLISLMYKLPREDCQCEFCVLLRRFEEIKKGIQ